LPIDGGWSGRWPSITCRVREGTMAEAILFYIVAAVIAGSALGCVLSFNVVRMATFLFTALGGVALLYFLMAATFLGAIQLIVYAGGTLIVIIFGVLLTSQSPWVKFAPRKAELIAGAMVCAALFGGLAAAIVGHDWSEADGASRFTAAEFGQALLTSYLVPFELASVLLLAVMIGAAYLARAEKRP
jgi:NADH-quinone oxidoreductase subunit J